MQNILDHIQCGIFVLTIEPTPEGASDGLNFEMRFAIANLPFVHLVFGERSIDQTVDLIGLQPHECLPSEFVQSLNSHVSECLRSQQRVEYEAKLNLITNRLLLISLSLKTCDSDNSQQIIGGYYKFIAIKISNYTYQRSKIQSFSKFCFRCFCRG